jgi:hypothetical protein
VVQVVIMVALSKQRPEKIKAYIVLNTQDLVLRFRHVYNIYQLTRGKIVNDGRINI